LLAKIGRRSVVQTIKAIDLKMVIDSAWLSGLVVSKASVHWLWKLKFEMHLNIIQTIVSGRCNFNSWEGKSNRIFQKMDTIPNLPSNDSAIYFQLRCQRNFIRVQKIDRSDSSCFISNSKLSASDLVSIGLWNSDIIWWVS
jgi:hypothetical protein